MSPLEYLGGAIEGWPLYVALLALSSIVHWYALIRRCSLGFFDPLFFVLIGSAFGWPLVWFMYFQGDIDFQYVVSFSVAELAFDAGLLILYKGPRQTTLQFASTEPTGFAEIVLFGSALLHVLTTCATWALAGIPLFRASRQGAFADSGGFGILERFSDACGPIALFTAFFLLIGHRRQTHKWACYLFIAWYAVALGLSGSKSALLVIGQIAFVVACIYTPLGSSSTRFWGGRAGKLFIGFATAFALLVVVVQFNGDASWETALIGLVYRFVSFGDIYIFAYPGHAIDSVPGSNPFIGLFGGFLSTFRLFPQDATYPNIGYALAMLAFPDLDYAAGPNPRHPVFAYHYFGQAGFLLSFTLGLLTAWLHRHLFRSWQRNYLPILLAFLGYLALVSISVDFEYSLSRLASTIISLSLVLPPAFFLRPRTAIFNRRSTRPRAVQPPLGAWSSTR